MSNSVLLTTTGAIREVLLSTVPIVRFAISRSTVNNPLVFQRRPTRDPRRAWPRTTRQMSNWRRVVGVGDSPKLTLVDTLKGIAHSRRHVSTCISNFVRIDVRSRRDSDLQPGASGPSCQRQDVASARGLCAGLVFVVPASVTGRPSGASVHQDQVATLPWQDINGTAASWHWRRDFDRSPARHQSNDRSHRAIFHGIASVRYADESGAVCVVGLGCFFLPDRFVSDLRKTRERQILRALPGAVDVLSLSVEAGLEFLTAMQRLVERGGTGPLRDELTTVLNDIRIGQSRAEALKAFAQRVEIAEVSSFVSVMVQADMLGASIGPVLRQQAERMRVERFQRAEKAGARATQRSCFR